MPRRPTIVLLLSIGLIVASCGDSGGGVEITDAWARASAGVQNAGAVYMDISAGDDPDALIGVSVTPDVAAMAAIHETTMSDEGAMRMSPVSSIEVPGGGSVSLAPGGYHVMLMNLAEPLADGATFDVELTFSEAGTITVEVEVREE